jgi:hypothetical protein
VLGELSFGLDNAARSAARPTWRNKGTRVVGRGPAEFKNSQGFPTAQRPECHPDRGYCARGLCRPCYAIRYKTAHRTWTRPQRFEADGTKVCVACGTRKDNSDFGPSSGQKCMACWRPKRNLEQRIRINSSPELTSRSRATAARRSALALAIMDGERAKGCVDCGEKDLRVLDFDHIRGKKLASLSTMRLCAPITIYAEIDKCEIRCANCHRRVTDARRKVR